MTENIEAGGPNAYIFQETGLFPDGYSDISGGKNCINPDTAMGYVIYYPGFDIDYEDSNVQRAKLAAVASVLLDREMGVPTRPDLARVISDRNYPKDHVLAVPHEWVKRRLKPGKEKALSESTVVGYGRSYPEDGVRKLGLDVGRVVMALRHREDAKQIIQTENSLLEIARTYRLRAVLRILNDSIGRGRPTSSSGSRDLNGMDVTLEGIVKALNRLGEQPSLEDRALDTIRDLGGVASYLCRSRTSYPFASMADSRDLILFLKGTNTDRLNKLKIIPPKERESIVTPVLTPEELMEQRRLSAERAEQRRLDEQATREKKTEDEEERVAAIDAENLPILERIMHIADEYNRLIDGVYECNGKILRDKHILGQDSVMGHMLKEFDSYTKQTLDNSVRLYAGLVLDSAGLTTRDELMVLARQAAELKTLYEDAFSELQPGGSRLDLPELKRDFVRDLMWLDSNFETMYVDCIDTCKTHVNAVGEESINRVINLLAPNGEDDEDGLGNTEPVDDVVEDSELPEIEDVDKPHVTLAEVRALAETVDWTIMPSEKITIDDLRKVIHDMKEAMQRKGKTALDDKVLLEERLQMILDWREKYNAKLVYSSKK